MVFKMWTIWHLLFFMSPAIILYILWYLIKDKPEEVKWKIGNIIGILSLIIITMRNLDIYIRSGFNPQIIPLQVCHFGNILVFISLSFKNKTIGMLTFYFNLPFALASLVEAEALANYSTILAIRPMAYIWGHILIVVGAIYPVMFKLFKFETKYINKIIKNLSVIFLIAMFFNVYFNTSSEWSNSSINYFYAYSSDGVPFKFLEGVFDFLIIEKYGLDLFYTMSVFVIGIIVIGIMHFVYLGIENKLSFDNNSKASLIKLRT